MKIIMIRHGATKGNLEGRYVGWTDEDITKDSEVLLENWRRKEKLFGQVTDVIISPMSRCRQTADILFPDKKPVEEIKLKECHFGDFEYKNYRELNGNPLYQKYIDSNGESGFPNGETKARFQARCIEGFSDIMNQYIGNESKMPAFVVHGGTIMSILHEYSNPHKDYFEWHIHNGEGFVMDIYGRENGFVIEQIEKIGCK